MQIMKKTIYSLIIMCLSLVAISQTQITSSGITGSGTISFLPKFVGSKKIGNSIIGEAGGFVRIGTQVGSYKLNVVTDISALGLFETNQSNGYIAVNATTNVEYSLLLNGTRAVAFGTGSSGTYIDKTGTMTIGTNEGGAQWLRLLGSGTELYIGQSSFTKFGYASGDISFIEQDANSHLGVGTSSDKNLLFFTNNTERFRIKNTGVLNLAVTTNSSPSDGDLWNDGTHLYFRIGGVTKQLDN